MTLITATGHVGLNRLFAGDLVKDERTLKALSSHVYISNVYSTYGNSLYNRNSYRELRRFDL